MNLCPDKWGRPPVRCERCRGWTDRLRLITTKASPYTVEGLCKGCAKRARVELAKELRTPPAAFGPQTGFGQGQNARSRVYRRDGGCCRYCGEPVPRGDAVSMDHVLPRSRGGSGGVDNLVLACKPCNGRKGDRTPEEAGMPLLPVPLEEKICEPNLNAAAAAASSGPTSVSGGCSATAAAARRMRS